MCTHRQENYAMNESKIHTHWQCFVVEFAIIIPFRMKIFFYHLTLQFDEASSQRPAAHLEEVLCIWPMIDLVFRAICNTSSWWHSPQFGEMCPESLLDTKLIGSRCGYTPKCWDIHVFTLIGIGLSNNACRNLRLTLILMFVGKCPERELEDLGSPTMPVRFSNSIGRKPG